jgi:hypothetical protein
MKPLYKALLFGACLLMSVPLLSQKLPPVIEWQKSLGGSKVDRANSVIRTLDNGYLVVGLSFSNDGQVTGHHGSTDSSDAWVVKLDNGGSIQWQKSLGGTGTDDFRHVLQASNGDFICVGSSTSNDGDVSGAQGQPDLWICRLSSTGTLLWSKLYGGPELDWGHVIRRAVDGGYIVAGHAYSQSGDITNHFGWSDIWVMKINDAGAIQWQKKFGNYNDQFVNDVTVTSDGGYVVTGYQKWRGQVPTCPGSPMYAYYSRYIFKLNAAGNALWENFGGFQCGNPGPSVYTANSIEMPGGQLFTVGNRINATTESDATLRYERLSAQTGQVLATYNPGFQTSRIAPTHNGSFANSVVSLQDSSILGTFPSIAAGFQPNRDATLVRLNTQDTQGTINRIYDVRFGGSNHDEFNALYVVNEAEFIAAGYSNSNNGHVSGNHGDYDCWVVKFNELNTITGRVFADDNANGIKDPTENYFANVKVTSTKAGRTVASSTTAAGLFINRVDTGSYSTTVNLIKPYFTINPASKVSTFANYNTKDSFNFALVPIPNKKDLKVSLSSTSPLRPGFEATYSLSYVNEGTEVLNNVVVKLLLPFNMDFVSAVPAHSNYANDTVTWNIGTLAPMAGASISIKVKADPPPALSLGDIAQVVAVVEPVAGDETPADNRDTVTQMARTSYDPNDKAESLNGTLLPDQVASKNLTYTIRFQNTGNDTAFNVVIRDTLDAKLDLQSLEMVSASHPYHLSIKEGNKLAWTFSNILLPDSNTNEPLSHGYIIYRIKPQSTLVVGDVINNSASIYFDFNLPVKTNTTQTVVRPAAVPQPSVSGVAANYCSTQGVQTGKINNLPVAASGITVSVKLDGNALAVAADSTFSFDVSALAAGAHAIVVTYSNGSETKTSTINFNVDVAVSPDVNVGANITNATNLLDAIAITATNAAGGGSSPLYAFAKDRGVTNLWQAESGSNVLNITGNDLQSGDNWIYVRMKTSAACFTTASNIDSIKLTLALPVPNNPVITGLKAAYCANEGIQKAKLANYPAAGTGTTVTVKLDGNALALNMADTSFSFNLTAGNRVVEATYANAAGTRTATANFTVTNAVTPDFEITGFSTQIISTNPITMGAVNITGGGTAPTFTFALDRNFTNILRAEGTDPSLTFDPVVLKIGANKVYVRMKSSATCYTQQAVIDSITITKYGASGVVDPDFPTQRISANPNPFRSRLVVHGINAAKAYTLTIHNHQGKKVYQRRVAGAASATLNVPALPAGIYTLSIYDETKARLIGTINIAKQ